MIKKIKYFIGLFLLLILSGCWDVNENERMYYAQSVGLDYQDNEFIFYIQIISFGNVAKSDQTNQDIIQTEVGSSKGKTIDEAISKLYDAIDEQVYLGHLTFFIVTENVLQGGHLNSLITAFTRHPYLRYNTWIYCTNQPLIEILNVLPLLKKSITLSKVADPLNSFEQNSFIEPINIRKLNLQLNDPSHEAKIPYVKINKTWVNNKSPNSTYEINGVGVITLDEFKGYIEQNDANGLQWTTNETFQGLITSKIKTKENDYLSVKISNVEPKIIPIVDGNKVQFDIKVHLKGTLSSFTGNLTVSEIREAIQKGVKKDIENTYKKGLEIDVDIYRLSEHLYRQDVKAWKEIEKDRKITLTEDSLRNVDVIVDQIESGRKSFEDSFEK